MTTSASILLGLRQRLIEGCWFPLVVWVVGQCHNQGFVLLGNTASGSLR